MKQSERFSMSGQVALVLGGSSGIGRAIALGFADAGALVVPVGKTRHKVDEVGARLAEGGFECTPLCADLTTPGAIEEVVTQVLREHGRIDTLVNSQGVTVIKPAEDFSIDEYDTIMSVNVQSVFAACQVVGRSMLERGQGSIVNIGSLASFRGIQNTAVYTMSKHAVLGLTRVLAAEWAPRGVRVNAIAPGFFMTDLNRERMSPERKEKARSGTPMDRFGELDELVGAAIYLCSPGAGFVTGEMLRVDGGFLASAW